MSFVVDHICRKWLATGFTAGAIVAGFSGLPSFGASQYFISQKGQAFTPKEIVIQRRERLQILNDDGDLRHHAYINSEKFSF